MSRLMVRGASHASEMVFSIEGFPSDFVVDETALAAFMVRRAPGRDALSTQRFKSDRVVLGHVEGGYFGRIANTDVRPQDYGAERTIPRPGHADFGQWIELGHIPTGGGKNSGRMTAALCAAGGICKQFLESRGITVEATIGSIGKERRQDRFEQAILKAKKDLDSVGGTIRCSITGVRPGLGGALFNGLESAISSAVFAIPGVKGVAFGNGFGASELRGSENNDAFRVKDRQVITATNRHGGILGGRTTGMPIEFTVAMKPTPTIYQEQASVDLATREPARLVMKGRHDPCIVRRALPVVEAMAAYALADAILADETLRPRICLTLTGKTLAEDLEQYEGQRYFTDMVELRLDLLKKSEREKVHGFFSKIDERVPVILTLRRKCDGGMFDDYEDKDRMGWFRRFTIGYKPTKRRLYFDFEDGFGHPSVEKIAKGKGIQIIRSLHDFKGKPRNLVATLKELHYPGGIPKIAFKPRNLAEVAKACEELSYFHDFPYVVCAMGPTGFPSRILASRFGSAWVYASVGGLEELGHITPHELVRTYRFRTQISDWPIYGVTGWPLKVSRSPELHNLAWSDEDEDAVMVPFPSKTAKEAIGFFRKMGLRGMAVTIPHKETIMPLLDKIDPAAKAIGAVNTVVCEGTRLVGYNTDEPGFAEAILHFMGRTDLKGVKAAVLGAGGASKAVVHALKRLKARPKVFHRETPSNGFDLIVNATPVDPIPDYVFTGREAVYDLVYVPEVTPLIARAKKAGCKVENGFSMLIAQAREQRRLWRNA